MRVAVVGGGVIGITTAVAIKKNFPAANVTIFADLFSPDTTGDGSAGLWSPYLTGNTNSSKIIKWSLLTHKWMETFWKSGLATDAGISLIPIYRATSDSKDFPLPTWASIPYGTHELSKVQLQRLNSCNNSKYSGAIHYVTFTCEPVKLLPWLMDEFKKMKGKIEKRKILNLKELQDEGFDVVINCTGIGSKILVSDNDIVPVRGQVSRVHGPWIFEAFLEDDDAGNYVIPNFESVVLGGTHQEGDYDTSVRESDDKFISKGCQRLYPSLTNCEVQKNWVGLRPGRDQVRLEYEKCNNGRQEDLLIIHNYGHGGSGVTLSWGCALEVLEILRKEKKYAIAKL